MALFVQLVKEVLAGAPPPPAEFDCLLELRRVKIDGVPILLPPYAVKSVAWGLRMHDRAASAETARLEGRYQLDMEAGQIAFDLVRKLYHWFGHESDAVPYTEEIENTGRVVSPGLIERA